MDKSAWLGLGMGIVIGSAYAGVQARSLRQAWVRKQQGRQPELGKQAGGALLRLAGLAVVVVVALQCAPVNKWWFGGGLAAAYGVLFYWKLRMMTSKTN